MNTKTSYLINNRTKALFSYYELTNEYTKVIEGRESFIVQQSWKEIVRASFHYLENNLVGALHLARKVLKRSDNIPIALSAARNLILICCKAPNQDGVILIISSHIQEIHRYRINQTTVLLKNGLSFHVDMNVNALQDQRRWADSLCDALLNQAHQQKVKHYLYDPMNKTAHVLEDGQLKYIMKRNKEDDEDLDMVLK